MHGGYDRMARNGVGVERSARSWRWSLVLLGLCAGFGWSPVSLALEIERWETTEGLRVLYAPAPALPMLDIRLTLDAGSARDGEQHGLASLVSALLRDGTAAWDTDHLAERFESVGAEFSTSAARDMGIVSLRTLTEADWQATAIDTLVQVLAAPAFREADLERRVRQMLQALQRERQEPGTLASRQFYALLYAGHPYANPPSGREETLADLHTTAVTAFYRQYYVAANATLALTGAISRADAHALAQRIAQALPQGERAPALPPVVPPAEPIVARVAFPSEQAHLLMGVAVLRRGDPDHYALSVANHVLGGGGFTSRLFDTVRNQRGLAYSVFSSLQPMAAEGPFLINLQTGADQVEAARAVVEEEWRRWHQEPIAETELAATVANLVGGFPLRLASNRDIVANLGMMGFYDLPTEYLREHNDQIRAVTSAQAHAAVQRRLPPAALVTVIVGGGTK